MKDSFWSRIPKGKKDRHDKPDGSYCCICKGCKSEFIGYKFTHFCQECFDEREKLFKRLDT